MQKTRCAWASDEPIYRQYHDEEWGKPTFDDRALFELLILEGVQAGLSWITVLKKRENYRACFDNFDAEKMARYSDKKVQELLANPGIVRNRLKVAAAITNAQAYLRVKQEYKSFADYLWQFVDGKPLINHWQDKSQVPAKTALSDKLSKDLQQRGFKFVGSTICYAYMQAVGMVNDHTQDCFLHGK